MISFDSNALKLWFHNEKRQLPWRETDDPYAIWVSEVMLQQTQVSVVIPYYERWLQLFPTIQALAAAPIDAVIKCWEGLGYYSRARRLHAAARYVMEKHGGTLPDCAEELNKIPGLGPYTVGAILSFAFKRKIAAVDGNVMRVLARYFAISEAIDKTQTVRQIWSYAQQLLPDEEPWLVNEALIELGATVCMRQPKCQECPLRRSCSAHAQGLTKTIPYKTNKVKVQQLYRAVTLITAGERLLVKQAAEGEIMSGLLEFPYFETGPEGISAADLASAINVRLGVNVSFAACLPDEHHSFTRYRAHLFPLLFQTSGVQDVLNHTWLTRNELSKLAFSSGHRRIYQKASKILTDFGH